MAIAPERVTMRIAFENACAAAPEWVDLPRDTKDTLLRRMERNCFEVTITSCTLDGVDRLFTDKKFIERYSTVCARVMANLNPGSSVGSAALLKKLISGEVDPYKIAEMSSFELCPEASQAERDEIELRKQQKFENKVSHAYTCRKCGQNETIFIHFQARSADESESTSIKCIHCENVWRR